MKSEILVVHSIQEGAGFTIAAHTIASSAISQLQESGLNYKVTQPLIEKISQTLTTITQKDLNNTIDYSNPNAPEVLAFNEAIKNAQKALEKDKLDKLEGLSSSHATLHASLDSEKEKIAILQAANDGLSAELHATKIKLEAATKELVIVKKIATSNGIDYWNGNCSPTLFIAPASSW